MGDTELPPGWREMRLGELGSFSRGRGGTRADEEPNGLPCIRYGDLYTHHDCIVRSFASSISPASAASYTRLLRGDVVFAGSGETFEEIGKAAAYCGDSPAYAGADTIIFRPGPDLLPHFAGYAVNSESANAHKSRMGQGSSVIHIGSAHLAQMLFKLPPREQQQRIAEILSTVDEAIEQTEALIAKTQQIKAGLMHDLFTRGVAADGQLRPPLEEAPQLYKESPLGWIPREWKTVLLDDIATRGSGHTPSKNHPEYWNGTIRWVSLADSWRLDRVHISDTDHKITQAGIENSSAVLHPPGIVVLSRDAGVGKSAVTTSEMAVSQHFMCWRCGPRLHNYYLYYWLQHRKWEFENIATGSTIPTIGLRFFRHYRVSVPVEVAEQSRIAGALLAADEQVFALADDLWKLRCLRVGLMKDLLIGRVSLATHVGSSAKEVTANV